MTKSSPLTKELLYPSALDDVSSLRCIRLSLPPGASTTGHSHHEVECFIVSNGEGLLVRDTGEQELSPGQVVVLPPLTYHQILNTSDERLELLDLWWRDDEALQQRGRAKPVCAPARRRQRQVIMPSYPTPNGPLHLGHLAGPYLAADIQRRYLQLGGHNPALIIGTLGHQTQVATAAKAFGRSFDETSLHYSAEIQQGLDAAGIVPDVFVTQREYDLLTETAHDFVNTLLDAGHLVPQTRNVFYCEGCAQYLFEAHLEGECPHCGSHVAGECEGCAHYIHDHAVKNPRCAACKGEPVLRPLRRLFFSLERFREVLIQQYQQSALSPALRAFCDQVLQAPLPEVPLTIVSEDGIALPIKGYPGQRLYSPCELVPRYLTALRVMDAQVDDVALRLFFGFDNAYLRAVIFPALLKAYAPDAALPEGLYMNQLYQLEGAKFSTSRNHRIDLRAFTAAYGADATRWYVAATRAAHDGGNFTYAAFQSAVADELVSEWSGWLLGMHQRLRSDYQGIVPAAGLWYESHHTFHQQLVQGVTAVQHAYSDRLFSPTDVVRELGRLVEYARQFARDYPRHYVRALNPAGHRTGMALELMAAKTLATLILPVMPRFGSELWSELAEAVDPTLADLLTWVTPGMMVQHRTSPYFTLPRERAGEGSASDDEYASTAVC